MSKWRTTTIGQLVDERVIHPPTDGNHGEIHPKGSDFVEQGIPFVMASDIERSVIDLTNCKFISKNQAQNLRKGFAIEGDVLLTHKATIGRTALVPKIDTSYIMLTPQVTYYRVKNREVLDNKFLKYYFDFKPFQETLALWSGAGSTRAYLGIIGQRNLTLRLPETIHIQKNIAAVLYALDAKIDCNNRISAELGSMAKTLYDYWFVQFEIPDANGKPYRSSGGKMVYNTTLKREIPEGWRVDGLSNLTSLIRRGVSPSYVEFGGMLVLNQKCIREEKISFLDARRHSVILETENERLLRPFDVLINSTGVGTLGRVAFVKRLNEEKTTVDSHVTIVRADPKQIHSEYLAWTILHFQPVIEAAANGSTGQVELNKTFIEDLNILVPNTKQQQRFSAFVSPLVKQLAEKEKEVEQLTQLRDWLLPLLMNGQVTVA